MELTRLVVELTQVSRPSLNLADNGSPHSARATGEDTSVPSAPADLRAAVICKIEAGRLTCVKRVIDRALRRGSLAMSLFFGSAFL